MKIRVRVCAFMMAVCMVFPMFSFQKAMTLKAEDIAKSNKLEIDWAKIKEVGNQPSGKNSVACSCYAMAYSKTILDGKVHKWYEYNKNKSKDHSNVNAQWWVGGYNNGYTSGKTKEDKIKLFQTLYNAINAGRPIILYVTVPKGGQHYVAIVGYTNVTDLNSLSESNFLMIDSLPSSSKSKVTNLGKAGYKARTVGGKFHYVYTNKGGVATSLDKTNSEKYAITEDTYIMVNKKSGMALQVAGDAASSKNKGNVQIGAVKVTNNKNQSFKVSKTKRGWYALLPLSNQKLAVNPYSDAPKSGTNVNVYTKSASDRSQGWYFEQVGDYYVIRSAFNTNLVLTEAGTAAKSNVKVSTYKSGNENQLWYLVSEKNSNGSMSDILKLFDAKKPMDEIIELVKAMLPENEEDKKEEDKKEEEKKEEQEEEQKEEQIEQTIEGTYHIVNKESGKLLDVYGDTEKSTNKSNVQVYAKQAGSNLSQQFQVKKTSGGWYSIVPCSNKKLAVNPFSDTPKNGTNVNVYTLDASDKTQGWYLEKEGDYYIIRSAYNKNIVLTESGTKDKSNVKVATYKSGDSSQLWSLVTP